MTTTLTPTPAPSPVSSTYTLPDLSTVSPTFTINSQGTGGSWLSDYTLTSIPPSLTCNGTIVAHDDIMLQDRSLIQRLEEIERRLGILHSRPDLEERLDELREVGDKYREMVDWINEKQKMWDTIAGNP